MKNDLAVLGRKTCVYVFSLIVSVEDALSALGWPNDCEFIDIDGLPETDTRRGYPSPTLLWRGKEIFGMPEPTPPFTNH